MPSATVTLDTRTITDWSSFHGECASVFGFPSFYGRNMDAWIDCLTYLPEGDGMSSFVLGADGRLFIEVLFFVDFMKRLPEVCAGLLECTAFVNLRYVEVGDSPRLVLVLR
jgi:hypothetical protein